MNLTEVLPPNKSPHRGFMTSKKRIILEQVCKILNIEKIEFLTLVADGTIKLSAEVFWNGSFHSVHLKQIMEALRTSAGINMAPNTPLELYEFFNPLVSLSDLQFREETIIKLRKDMVLSPNVEVAEDSCVARKADKDQKKESTPADPEKMGIVLKVAKKEMSGLDIKKAKKKWVFRDDWNLAAISRHIHSLLASSHPGLNLKTRTINNILSHYRTKGELPLIAHPPNG